MANQVLLSLFVLIIGVSGALSRIRKHACELECVVAVDNGNYTVGRQYIYEYSTTVTSSDFINRRITKKRRENSVSVDAEVTIEVISKCQMALTITKVKMETDSTYGVLPSQKDKAGEAQIIAELKQNPLYFRFENGYIDNLCGQDDLWIRNFKRGILSSLNGIIGLPDKRLVEAEVSDVNGLCPTTYNRLITTARKGDRDRVCSQTSLLCDRYRSQPFDSGIFIIAKKDLRGCRGPTHQRLDTSVSSTPYTSNSPIQHVQLSDTFHLCETVVQGGIVKDVMCAERFEFPVGPKASVAKTYIGKRLTFLTSRTECGPACKAFKNPKSGRSSATKRSLLFEFDMSAQQKQTNGLQEAETLLCKLVTSPSTYQDAPRHFIQLVRIMRKGQTGGLLRRAKKLCKNMEEKTSRRILLDIAQAAATPSSIRFIMEDRRISQEEKDRRLSALVFTKTPSERLLQILGPTMKLYASKYRRTARTTAALVSRYCRIRPDCMRSRTVSTIANYVQRRLTLVLLRPDRYTERLLSVVANMADVRPIVKLLFRYVIGRRSSTAVRVAALDAISKTKCSHWPVRPKVDLLPIIQNRKWDAEVRIAAFRAFVPCASYSDLRRLSAIVSSMRNYQVGRYIETYVNAVRDSSDPTQQDLRRKLQDIRYFFPKRVNERPFQMSGHYERSFFSPGRNFGAKVQADFVWSEKEKYPRSVSASADAFLFSQRVNLVELRGRQEGLSNLKRGFSSWQERKEMFAKVKRNKALFDAKLAVRVFGYEVLSMEDVITRNQLLDLIKRRGLDDVIKRVFKPWKLDFRQMALLADTTAVIATSVGLPFRLNVRAAASSAVKGHSSFDFEALRFNKGFRFAYSITPHADVTVEADLNVDLKQQAFGLKFRGTGHTTTTTGIKVYYKGDRSYEMNFEFDVPQQQKYLTLKWESLYIHQNTILPTDATEDQQPAIFSQLHSKAFETAFGHQLIFSMQKRLTERIFSSNEINLYMKRTDKHSKQVVNIKLDRNGLYFLLDTPGSTINRKISGVITAERRDLNIKILTPWKTVDVRIVASRLFSRNLTIDVYAKMDGKTYLDIKHRRLYNYISKGGIREFRYKTTARIRDTQILTYNAYTKNSMDDKRFEIVLKEPLQIPFRISGNLNTIKANKFSIGRQHNAALEISSRFLKSKTSGTFEVAKKKFTSKVQLDYDLPLIKNAKGTVASKIRYTRMREKAVKEIIVSQLTFSQFPFLNTDLTMKASTVSLTNFRRDLVLKYGEKMTPLRMQIDLASERDRERKLTVKFGAGYSLSDVSSANVNFSLSTAGRKSPVYSFRMYTGVQQVHKGKKSSLVIECEYNRRTHRDSLEFRSELTPYGVSFLRTLSRFGTQTSMRFNVTNKNQDVNAQPFGLTVKYNHLRSLQVGMGVKDWVGRYSMVRPNRQIGAVYSLSENSRLRLSLRGSFAYRSRNFTFQETAKSGSSRLYSISMRSSYFRRVPKGLFELALGPVTSERTVRLSFMHSRLRHKSSAEVKTLKRSWRLNNELDYKRGQTGAKSVLQVEPGLSMGGLGFVKRLSFVRNGTNTRSLFVSQARMEFGDEFETRFVEHRFSLKRRLPGPKMGYQLSTRVASSYLALKSAQLEHGLELTIREGKAVKTNTKIEFASAYSARDLSLDYLGMVNKREVTTRTRVESKVDGVPNFLYSSRHRVSRRAVDVYFDMSRPNLGIRDGIKASVKVNTAGSVGNLGIKGPMAMELSWKLRPRETMKLNFLQPTVKIRSRLSLRTLDADLKAAVLGKNARLHNVVNITSSRQWWSVRVRTEPLGIGKMDVRTKLHRRLCAHTSRVSADQLSVDSNVDLCGQEHVVKVDAQRQGIPIRMDYFCDNAEKDRRVSIMSQVINRSVNLTAIVDPMSPMRINSLEMDSVFRPQHSISLRHNPVQSTVRATLPSMDYSNVFAQATRSRARKQHEFAIRLSGEKRLLTINASLKGTLTESRFKLTADGLYQISPFQQKMVDLANATILIRYRLDQPSYFDFSSPFLGLLLSATKTQQKFKLQQSSEMSYRGKRVGFRARVNPWFILVNNQVDLPSRMITKYIVRYRDQEMDAGLLNVRMFDSKTPVFDIGADFRDKFVKAEARMSYVGLLKHSHEMKIDMNLRNRFNMTFKRVFNVSERTFYYEQRVNLSSRFPVLSSFPPREYGLSLKQYHNSRSRVRYISRRSHAEAVYSYNVLNGDDKYLKLMEKRTTNGQNELDFLIKSEPRNTTVLISGSMFGQLGITNPLKQKLLFIYDQKNETQTRVVVKINGLTLRRGFFFRQTPHYNFDFYFYEGGYPSSIRSAVTVDREGGNRKTKRLVHWTAATNVTVLSEKMFSKTFMIKDELLPASVQFLVENNIYPANGYKGRYQLLVSYLDRKFDYTMKDRFVTRNGLVKVRNIDFLYNGEKVASMILDARGKTYSLKFKSNGMKQPFIVSVTTVAKNSLTGPRSPPIHNPIRRPFSLIEVRTGCGDPKQQLLFRFRRDITRTGRLTSLELQHQASDLDIGASWRFKPFPRSTSSLVLFRRRGGRRNVSFLMEKSPNKIIFQGTNGRNRLTVSRSPLGIRIKSSYRERELLDLTITSRRVDINAGNLGSLVWVPGRVIGSKRVSGRRRVETFRVDSKLVTPWVIRLSINYKPRQFFSGVQNALDTIDAVSRVMAKTVPAIYKSVRKEVVRRRDICPELLTGLKEFTATLRPLIAIVVSDRDLKRVPQQIQSVISVFARALLARADSAMASLSVTLQRANVRSSLPVIRTGLRTVEHYLLLYQRFPSVMINLAARRIARATIIRAYNRLQTLVAAADLTEISRIHAEAQSALLAWLQQLRGIAPSQLRMTGEDSAVERALTPEVRRILRKGIFLPTLSDDQMGGVEKLVGIAFDLMDPQKMRRRLRDLLSSNANRMWESTVSSVDASLWTVYESGRDVMRSWTLPPRVRRDFVSRFTNPYETQDTGRFIVTVFIPRQPRLHFIQQTFWPMRMLPTNIKRPDFIGPRDIRTASLQDGYVRTFDGLRFSVPEGCGFVLARTRKWQVSITRGVPRIVVRNEGATVTVEHRTQDVKLNGKQLELPSMIDELSIAIEDSDVTIDGDGFSVRVNLEAVPNVNVTSFPHLDVTGLFGNIDNDPNNDTPLPGRPWNSNVNAYIQSLGCRTSRPVLGLRTCPHLLPGRPRLQPGQTVEVARRAPAEVVFAIEFGRCWPNVISKLPSLIARLDKKMRNARFGVLAYRPYSGVSPITIRFRKLSPASAFNNAWARRLMSMRRSVQRALYNRQRIDTALQFYPFNEPNQHKLIVVPCRQCPPNIHRVKRVHVLDYRFNSHLAYLRRRWPRPPIYAFNGTRIFTGYRTDELRQRARWPVSRRMDQCSATALNSGGMVLHKSVLDRSHRMMEYLMGNQLQSRGGSSAIVCKCGQNGRLRCLAINKSLIP